MEGETGGVGVGTEAEVAVEEESEAELEVEAEAVVEVAVEAEAKWLGLFEVERREVPLPLFNGGNVSDSDIKQACLSGAWSRIVCSDVLTVRPC